MSAPLATSGDLDLLDAALGAMAGKLEEQIALLEKPPQSPWPAAVERELHERRRGLEVLHRMVDRLRQRAISMSIEPQSDAIRPLLVRHLLPILDSIDGGLDYSPTLERRVNSLPDATPFVTVYQTVRDAADNALTPLGLERIPKPEPGEIPDDDLHECVSVLDHLGLPPGSIAEVVRTGYRWRNDVLRPCEVTCVSLTGSTVPVPGTHESEEPSALRTPELTTSLRPIGDLSQSSDELPREAVHMLNEVSSTEVSPLGETSDVEDRASSTVESSGNIVSSTTEVASKLDKWTAEPAEDVATTARRAPGQDVSPPSGEDAPSLSDTTSEPVSPVREAKEDEQG